MDDTAGSGRRLARCRRSPSVAAWLTGSLLISLLMVAGFVLPDQPAQEEPLCRRYHAAAACRVW